MLISRKHLYCSLLLVTLVWLISITGIYLWAKTYWKITLPVRNAPFTVMLPKYMPVTTTVNNILTVNFNHRLDVEVPVDQIVNSSLTEDIALDVDLTTDIKLTTSVPFNAKVPVNAEFELLVPINTGIALVRIPVKLPLSFEIPVSLAIPVDVTIPVDLKTRVIGTVNETVPVHLKTILKSSVLMATELRTEVLTTVGARMTFPTSPTNLMVESADLNLLIEDIELQPATNTLNDPALQKNKAISVGFSYDAERKPPVLKRRKTQTIHIPPMPLTPPIH